MSTLNATGLSKEETLARESIQNSSDAIAKDSPKVTVRFTRRVLSKNRAAEFLKILGLDAIGERSDHLNFQQSNVLSTGATKTEGLSLLLVEDFGTGGLTGSPHDPASNFYRLLLSLGDSAKSREDNSSGGSYGFGKAAYFLNSKIRTILAHTAYEDSATNAWQSRVFGCGFFNRHQWLAKSYTGRAWFGILDPKSGASPIVDPLEGEDAQSFAKLVGFTTRNTKELQGTSILIIDSELAIQTLLESIETWWWPKLVENEIDVFIKDEESGQEFLPRPKSSKRPDLKPFIDSYQVAIGSVQPIKPHQKLEEFNRAEGLEIGGMGLTMLTPEQELHVGEARKNCVALIRQPRMVAHYLQVSTSAPPIVGSFVGAPDMDRYLKLSEPPAHNLWDPSSERLEIDNKLGARLVKSVLDRIKRKSKEFQNQATPPGPPRQNRLQRLERALGKYFMTKGKTPPTNEAGEAPIHLVYQMEPVALAAADDKLQLHCKFEIRLKDEAPESLRLKVQMRCNILEDETQKGDAVAFEITASGLPITFDANDPQSTEFDISKGQKARFEIKSAAYDPALSVSFAQEVSQL